MFLSKKNTSIDRQLTTGHSRGFSLIAALFVIVVLSLLAAAIFRMSQTSNIAVAQEALSIRAFYAAESGAQVAAMQIFPLSGVGSCASSVINFTDSGLVNCQASIQCSSFAADGETHYMVSSEGQCSAGDLAASRTIETMLKDL